MEKWNRKRVGILAICFLCTWYMAKEFYTIQPQRVPGIPDAINSIRCNTTEHLTVVANQKDMEGKHELAKRIVKMCQENSFQSIKFSYDVECPTELLIHVYPIASYVETVFKDFHEIIMGKSPEKIDDFIKQYEDSSIFVFCNGLKKDIAPVKNAISHPESSGFVEGNNNKFKLIKRIVYGRSGLVNLSKKCKLAFMPKDEAFTLGSLI